MAAMTGFSPVLGERDHGEARWHIVRTSERVHVCKSSKHTCTQHHKDLYDAGVPNARDEGDLEFGR